IGECDGGARLGACADFWTPRIRRHLGTGDRDTLGYLDRTRRAAGLAVARASGDCRRYQGPASNTTNSRGFRDDLVSCRRMPNIPPPSWPFPFTRVRDAWAARRLTAQAVRLDGIVRVQGQAVIVD